MENILCKYYRHLSPTCKDPRWYEMMMLSQPKIAMYNQVYSSRTQPGQFYCGEGHLIKEFPYYNETISPSEFAIRTIVAIGKTLPAERKLFTYVLPEGIVTKPNKTCHCISS